MHARDASRLDEALNRLSTISRDSGRSPEAMRLGQEAVESAQAGDQKDPNSVAAARGVLFALSDLARSHLQAGQRQRACQLAAQAPALPGPVEQSQGMPASLERMQRLAAGCQQLRRQLRFSALPVTRPASYPV